MPRPRFLADEMLGSLARWLRIMGYDTAYARGVTDGEVLREAHEGSRIVLTRDRQLAQRAGAQGLLIESDDLDEQLVQVSCALGLDLGGSMTRCTVCNGELRDATPEEVERLPPCVRACQDLVLRCPDCGQMYWQGTHWDRIRERLERLAVRCGSGPR